MKTMTPTEVSEAIRIGKEGIEGYLSVVGWKRMPSGLMKSRGIGEMDAIQAILIEVGLASQRVEKRRSESVSKTKVKVVEITRDKTLPLIKTRDLVDELSKMFGAAIWRCEDAIEAVKKARP